MVSARPEAVGTTKRPRNRRQLILDAAARAFTERGYHAASMEDIAAEVGITAAALYRHFPGKYPLFVDCVALLADRLVGVVAALGEDTDLEQLLRHLTAVTIDHRVSGGIHRWEARYLTERDRRWLRTRSTRVVDAVATAIRAEVRPGRSVIRDWDRLRAVAALGAIGSITMHHTTLARSRLDQTLLDAALRVIRAPQGRPGPLRPSRSPEPAQPTTRKAQILAAAVQLFDCEGFTNATMGAIARGVGITPSALYRHYPSKADILSAACLEAATILDHAVHDSLAGVEDPEQAVRALAEAYVAYSFEHRPLTNVAEAEIPGLPDPLKRPLVAAQHAHIAHWRDRLQAARPELDPRQARVLIHAGFGVVVEAGRWLHWQDTPKNRALVVALMLSALGIER